MNTHRYRDTYAHNFAFDPNSFDVELTSFLILLNVTELLIEQIN